MKSQQLDAPVNYTPADLNSPTVSFVADMIAAIEAAPLSEGSVVYMAPRVFNRIRRSVRPLTIRGNSKQRKRTRKRNAIRAEILAANPALK